MSAVAAKLTDVFAEDAKRVNIFFGGRNDIEYTPLTQSEIDAINLCLDINISRIRKIAPSIAADLELQRPTLIKFGGVAKAKFPGQKSITFPSQSGNIGVNFLFPAAIRYYNAKSSSYPTYSDFAINSWDITLTAGTATYLFGSSAQFYKASPTLEQHSMLVIAQHGLIEVGTTPRFEQQRIITQAESKYGIIAEHPLNTIPIETHKWLYQHPTPGIIPVYHDFGIRWTIMPMSTGVSTLRLLGLVYYEHDLYSDLTYVT